MSEALAAAPYLPPADRYFTHEEIAEGYDRIAREGWGVRIEGEPHPDPKPNRPDEFWWIRTDEDMPPEPACVSFKGDAPAKVQLIGDDSACGTPVEEFQWTHTDEDGVTTVNTRLELVERILPPGRVAEVITLLEEVHREQSCSWPEQALDRAMGMLRGEPAEAEA
ncbi:hypothetical protein [Methylobacterium mesophilicum]